MRQRDCDPISFPRRKEIASPVKERTPKGDSSLPIRRIGNRIGAYGLRCSPFGNPFCEQPPRGRETKKRKRRGRRLDAPPTTSALTAMNVGATLAVARVTYIFQLSGRPKTDALYLYNSGLHIRVVAGKSRTAAGKGAFTLDPLQRFFQRRLVEGETRHIEILP